MKICQINCVYGEGSTGKIVRAIHLSLLEKKYNSTVLYPLKNQYSNEKGVFIFSNRLFSNITASYRRILGLQYDGAFFQTNKIIKFLKKESPDIVHLHCINGNNINVYRLLKFLATNEILTVLTLHSEFPYTGGCGHSYTCKKWLYGCGNCPNLKQTQSYLNIDNTARTWKKWKDCYDLFKPEKLILTSVSPWLEDRAKQSPMLKKFNIFTILNPINTEKYYYRDDIDIKKKYNIKKNTKIILHVTANFDVSKDNLKGGKFIIELSKLYEQENVQIVVAANYCNLNSLPRNIIFIGKLSDEDELANLYSQADVTIITSKRETFSMITAESLCCGTPVIGFKAGGPESICINGFSDFVEYGDIFQLKKTCTKWLQNRVDKKYISKIACQKFSKKVIFDEYEKIYLKVMGR